MRSKAPIGVLALLGATAVGMAFGYCLSQGHDTPGRRATAQGVDAAPLSRSAEPTQAPAPPAPARVAPMRAAIRKAIEEAPVRAEVDVAPYLDALERRAREQGAVTALEVQPGIAIIKNYVAEPDAEIERFSERMLKLQRSLQDPRERTQPPPMERQRQLERLAGDITHARSETEKQVSIAEYLKHAAALDPEAHDAALQRLNAIAGVRPPQADKGAANALWTGIERARDPDERQALIADYLELIRTLPEAEADARLADLSAKFGDQERRAPRR